MLKSTLSQAQKEAVISNLSIGEIASRSGLKASAIRYYESVKLLPSPPRRHGQRQYDASILTRLKIIEVAKTFNFTLDEIRLFFEGVSETSSPSDVWKAFAAVKMKALEDQIKQAKHLHQLLETGLTCKCLTLSDCTLPDLQATPNNCCQK